STFSSPILSAAFTFGLTLVGQYSTDLRNFQDVLDAPSAQRLARGLYWILPNLGQFDVKAQVVHGQAVALRYLAGVSLYAWLYTGFLLLVACVVFSRRDFK